MSLKPVEDAESLLETARAARLEFCVFRHDSAVPSEIAPVARLLWYHLPQIARQMGAEIRPDEGYPDNILSADAALVRSAAADIVASRPVSSWLNAHLSPEAKGMFARGDDNVLQSLFNRFARDKGFERSDMLAQEAGRANDSRPVSGVMAAMAAGFSR